MDRTFRRMKNKGLMIVPIEERLDDAVALQPLWEVNVNNMISPDNRLGEALRPQGERQNDN